MEVLLLLGGNVGDVVGTFHRAASMITERIGPIRSSSRDHWTEPWGFRDERLFLNRALVVDTHLSPEELLTSCLDMERELGRVRAATATYGPRPIDIDVLLWEDQVISLPHLQVPHPRMHERTFALAPAADVAPEWPHPVLERTVLTLLNDATRNA